MLRLSISALSAALLLGAPQLRAEGLSAAELLKEVENCSLKLTGEGPPIDAEAQAITELQQSWLRGQSELVRSSWSTDVGWLVLID